MKLVILDRDGTINEDSAEFVKSPEEWAPLPGALEAIARLNQAGWHVVIASNQSGLGRVPDARLRGPTRQTTRARRC